MAAGHTHTHVGRRSLRGALDSVLSREGVVDRSSEALGAVQAALAQWHGQLRLQEPSGHCSAGRWDRPAPAPSSWCRPLRLRLRAGVRRWRAAREEMKMVAAEGPGRGLLAVLALAAPRARGEGELEQVVL